MVTVHKSKGLEYPLVFLPFAADHRPAKATDLPLKWHDDDGQLQLSLDADGTVLERVDRERLGEDLRKLYVALTRARYATWVGLAPLDKLENSAFGYLLGGGESLVPERAGTRAGCLAWRLRRHRRCPGARADYRALCANGRGGGAGVRT